MKVDVKIEFSIEGEEGATREEIKEMIYTYLTEAMELEELDYDLEVEEENE